MCTEDVADGAGAVGDEQRSAGAGGVRRAGRTGNAGGRGRRWAATLFERNANEWALELQPLREVKYAILGNELCPKTGRPHVQAYVETSRMSWNRVCEMLHGAHVEHAHGTARENREYCAKDGSFVELGVMSDERQEEGAVRGGERGGERERDRWVDAYDAAVRGDWESIPRDVLIRYYGNLRRIQQDNVRRPDDLADVCGFWIYGPPGYGKSHAARALFVDNFAKGCHKWWDKYGGERAAIIDDLELSHDCLGHLLKIWGDRYATIGEIKHLGQWIRPESIVVTSNYSIHDVFGRDPVMEEAIRRRYVEIHFSSYRMDIGPFVRGRISTDGNADYGPSREAWRRA